MGDHPARRQLAAHRDLPRFTFIFFFRQYCSSRGRGDFTFAMSRHNILYTPHIFTTHKRTHTFKYVHYRGITIDLQDCLVKQTSIFMPKRREVKGKAKIWRILREGRATKNIPGVLPLLNDPKGFSSCQQFASLFS